MTESPAAARATERRARSGAGPDWAFDLAIWPLAAVLVIFIGVPLVALIWRTGSYGGEVSPGMRATLVDALKLSAISTTCAMLVMLAFGTPLAYILARKRFPGHQLIDTIVDLPIVLPPAVAGIALLMAFGRRGILGGWLEEVGVTIPFTTLAVIIAQIFVAAPFYIRSARGGFNRIEPGLEAAAADLGARPWRVFWTITLPLARPGLAAGAVLAWARALGEFGATIMFAGNLAGRTQTMPLSIYSEYGAGHLPTALWLAVILLGTSLVILAGSRLLLRSWANRTIGSTTGPTTGSRD